jgi:hypothetical protein
MWCIKRHPASKGERHPGRGRGGGGGGARVFSTTDARLVKKTRSRAHRTFTKHNQIQNQELAQDRLGESRRMAPFSRAQQLCPALASWRRPQERVKKKRRNKSFQVLPGPYVMYNSNTTITPRSVWELKTLHTNTNKRSHLIPQANSRHLVAPIGGTNVTSTLTPVPV